MKEELKFRPIKTLLSALVMLEFDIRNLELTNIEPVYIEFEEIQRTENP